MPHIYVTEGWPLSHMYTYTHPRRETGQPIIHICMVGWPLSQIYTHTHTHTHAHTHAHAQMHTRSHLYVTYHKVAFEGDLALKQGTSNDRAHPCNMERVVYMQFGRCVQIRSFSCIHTYICVQCIRIYLSIFICFQQICIRSFASIHTYIFVE